MVSDAAAHEPRREGSLGHRLRRVTPVVFPQQRCGELSRFPTRKTDFQSRSQPVRACLVDIMKVAERGIHFLQVTSQAQLVDQLQIFTKETRVQPAQHESHGHSMPVQTCPESPARKLHNRTPVMSTIRFSECHGFCGVSSSTPATGFSFNEEFLVLRGWSRVAEVKPVANRVEGRSGWTRLDWSGGQRDSGLQLPALSDPESGQPGSDCPPGPV
jgi:hypothetical protein